MPTVSVIIPTYNRVAYLKDAIESVLEQTFKDWELIVVIDGSKDGSRELVESYIRRDARIVCVWQKNRGYPYAVNRGLREARGGTYVAFLDDDDRWLPEKLELQVALMQSDPKIGFCYGHFRVYRKNEQGLEEGKLFPQIVITKFEHLSDAFVPPSTTLIKKSLIDEVGGFDPQYRVSNDFDLWLKLWQRCKIASIDKVLTTTVMDERQHAAQDEIGVSIETARILQNLELLPEYQDRKPLVKKWIALRFYLAGRMYLDGNNHFQAAKYFAKAILTDPLVGLVVQRPGEKEFIFLLKRIVTTYLAVPACLLKGLLNGRH